jgi:hypothetical protein
MSVVPCRADLERKVANSPSSPRPPLSRSPWLLWDAHVFSWGGIADHDELVERRIRWMGKTLKQLYAPVQIIVQRKLYTGTLLFKPAPGASENGFSDFSQLESVEVGGSYQTLL